jgi:Na+-transporting NADH:ubiquinone oxidoreductase subunit NqrE
MELLAVSTRVAIAYGIGLWVVLIVGPATVTALKGQ